MIDPALIREDPNRVRKHLVNRRFPADALEMFISLDREWREELQEVESLQHKLKTATPKRKPTDEEKGELSELSDMIQSKKRDLKSLEQSKNEYALSIPNILSHDTPLGDSDKDNVEIRKEGDIPTFDFNVQSHDALAQSLNLVDFEKASLISGSRFAVLKGWGARLERALIHFMLDMHTTSHGYEECMPPVLVNSKALQGTGQLPKFKEDLFHCADTDLWLSPTAEVQLTNLYQNAVIPAGELPIALTAHTACFRREAGSYGKDVKGLIRLHQFNKVELVQLVHPDQSERVLTALLTHAENILKALALPYRVVELCSADMGFSAGKTFDLEVWFPSQNCYREISSCSNFFDFQARRAMIRYKDVGGAVGYLHTINGSGLAVGRTFAALIENYQTKMGTVNVPGALKPYLGVETLT
ncbi:MAG: serine--tRNA ligase [Candidatus Margulisbacteria bacterium]|nr:serine--tRNA ligase [Candidatus Margulisiibacteriota bacterium]